MAVSPGGSLTRPVGTGLYGSPQVRGIVGDSLTRSMGPYSDCMTSRRSARLLGVFACAATLLVAGCGPDSGDADGTQEGAEGTDETPENALPEPEHEGDDTVRIPLGMVSPEGHDQAAPIDEDGRVTVDEITGDVQQTEIARSAPFGCEDTVSVIRSVPVVTDDPTRTAMEFLVQDQYYYHGEPEFRNPLAVSEGLTVDEVSVDDDLVSVELTGEPTVRSACESWQVHTQLDITARAASGASTSELTLDGVPLAQVLGIEPEPTPVTLREVTEVER